MGKFTGMLFTSDFDHTISDHHGNVPQANLDAIEYFIANGGRFCLNTGRSIPLAKKRALQIPCNAPCLLYNGAACYDYRTDTLHFVHALPDFAETLPTLLQEGDLCYEVQGIDGHYSPTKNPSRAPFLRKEGVEPICTENIPKPWIKLVLCGRYGNISERYSDVDPSELQRFEALREKARTLCAGQCYVTASLPRVIEIGNPNCNKGEGAKRLARALGCERLICAGDAPNDAQMLAVADFAFCPSDASPEILALPNIHSTVPAADGSLAAAIAHLDNLF